MSSNILGIPADLLNPGSTPASADSSSGSVGSRTGSIPTASTFRSMSSLTSLTPSTGGSSGTSTSQSSMSFTSMQLTEAVDRMSIKIKNSNIDLQQSVAKADQLSQTFSQDMHHVDAVLEGTHIQVDGAAIQMPQTDVQKDVDKLDQATQLLQEALYQLDEAKKGHAEIAKRIKEEVKKAEGK